MGGADPVANAAGVAQAIYPARSRDTRPAAVTLVDGKDWRAAISAAQLMSRPLRAPILLSDGDKLPDASQSALDELGPTGAAKAGNAQVIRIGGTAKPKGLRSTDVEGADPAALAQAIDKLHTAAAGAPTRVGGRRALRRARSSPCRPPHGRPRPAIPSCGPTATASPRPRRPPSSRTAARASTCSGRRR